jgi:hypothetical protein
VVDGAQLSRPNKDGVNPFASPCCMGL